MCRDSSLVFIFYSVVFMLSCVDINTKASLSVVVLHEGQGNFSSLAIKANSIGVAWYPSDRAKYIYVPVIYSTRSQLYCEYNSCRDSCLVFTECVVVLHEGQGNVSSLAIKANSIGVACYSSDRDTPAC